MHRQCAGCSLIFWLPALFLALGPTASAVDDEAPALESPASPPSNAASLIPANTPPTLMALGGAVRPGGHLVLAAYATDADSSLVQVLAALHLWGGEGAVFVTSEDSGIATVSVSGTEIVVSGVSAGSTEIAVKPAGSEFRVPVRVGSGE